jgi:Glyoxalase-like domain
MPVRFQLAIDCTDPDQLARFWAAALGYELEPPPAGFPTWDDYYRDIGVPEEELGIGTDRIFDPEGHPASGSRWSPRLSPSRTGCTSTSMPAAAERSRSIPADSESTLKPAGSPAWVPP